jgi:NADH-quinone oxidoreductase subunit J
MESVHPVLFYTLASVIIASALLVIRVRNIFYAALCLGITFFGIAGLYVTLKAEFLAGVQILIYVGAIIILVLFAIMLTQGVQKREQAPFNKMQFLAFLASLLTFLMGSMMILKGNWASPVLTSGSITVDGSAGALGVMLMRHYLVPFELVSVLLLAALIGALVISRKEEGGPSDKP